MDEKMTRKTTLDRQLEDAMKLKSNFVRRSTISESTLGSTLDHIGSLVGVSTQTSIPQSGKPSSTLDQDLGGFYDTKDEFDPSAMKTTSYETIDQLSGMSSGAYDTNTADPSSTYSTNPETSELKDMYEAEGIDNPGSAQYHTSGVDDMGGMNGTYHG